MTDPIKRHEILAGITRQVIIDDDTRVYLTLNFQDGEPFEIFMRCARPELYEWVTLATVLITRLLRSATPIEAIAAELRAVHSSGSTSHLLPDGRNAISIVSRIGEELERLNAEMMLQEAA